jgi:hypothetical protein
MDVPLIGHHEAQSQPPRQNSSIVEPQDSVKPAETPAFQIVHESKENHFFLPDVLESTTMLPVFFNENMTISVDDLQCQTCFREFETNLSARFQFMT